MPYPRLKSWVFIVSVICIALVEFSRHVLLAPYLSPLLNTGLAVLAFVLGSYAFTSYVFRIIEGVDAENRSLLVMTEAARREAEALHHIGESLASLQDFGRNLSKLAQQTQQLLQADWVGVALLDDVTREISWAATCGSRSEDHRHYRMKLGQGLTGRVVSSGSWLKTEDFPADLTDSADSYPTLTAEGLKAALAVPVEIRGSVCGALMIGYRKQRAFCDHDREVLSGVAGQIAIALDNARLYSQGQNLAILEERDRIAREMHDSLAQTMSFMHLKCETLQIQLASGNVAAASDQVTGMKKACAEAYADLRQTIFSLKTRLAANLDFTAHLAEYLHEFGRQNAIEIELAFPQGQDIRVDETTEVQLFRIIQEALTNVRKHARATRATVRLNQSENHLTATISDNGIGFALGGEGPSASEHFGFEIMRERAEKIGGTLSVQSAPGSGTSVTVIAPLSKRNVSQG